MGRVNYTHESKKKKKKKSNRNIKYTQLKLTTWLVNGFELIFRCKFFLIFCWNSFWFCVFFICFSQISWIIEKYIVLGVHCCKKKFIQILQIAIMYITFHLLFYLWILYACLCVCIVNFSLFFFSFTVVAKIVILITWKIFSQTANTSSNGNL